MIKARLFILIVLVLILAGILSLTKNVSQNEPGMSSIRDGTIKIRYSPDEWSFATTPEQILVQAYIPPCTGNFTYCLYLPGTQYQGTNFESAGLAISSRTDLSTEELCLKTPPRGFSSVVRPDKIISTDLYASSVFGNVGGAALGHYSSGSLYRLYIPRSSRCYELETRIAVTRYENYPGGSIKEFTPEMSEQTRAQIDELINGITLSGGDSHIFP